MKSIKELQAYAAARGMRIEVSVPKKTEHKKIVLEVNRKGASK